MFTHIKDLKFTRDGNLLIDNKLIEKSKNVNLDIGYGYNQYSVEWLYLLNHFEVDNRVINVNNIIFINCDSRLLRFRLGKKMVFKTPLYYKDVYRIVPNLTDYAVSKKGEVISIKTGKLLTIGNLEHGYPLVSVYDPDKKRRRSIGLHIVIARAWVSNKNPLEYNVVNHLNGDKSDYRVCNLEWTNGVNNNLHAKLTGLKTDNVKCIVRDTLTGEDTEVNSLADAASFIGYKRNYIEVTKVVNGVKSPKLLKGRYYVFRSDKPVLELHNKKSNTGPYQAKRILDGNVFEGVSLPELAIKINASPWNVHRGLIKGPSYPINGYQIRCKSDDPWPSPIHKKRINKPKSILATNKNNVLKFKSLRQATIHFGCDKTTISNRLNGKILTSLNGWTFKYLE